jgi:hypothetical protein
MGLGLSEQLIDNREANLVKLGGASGLLPGERSITEGTA